MLHASRGVAPQALRGAGRAHLHPGRPAVGVTILAAAGRIASGTAELGVPAMIEVEVRNPWPAPRLPLDPLEWLAVVTGRAGGCGREYRRPLLLDPRVAGGAGNEHLGVRSEERRVGKECRSRWS